MNHIIFRILSRSVVGCSPETIGEMAALNRCRSSSMAVLTLSISSLPAGSVAGDQMSRSANSTAMSRGRVVTGQPPLRAANLFRMLRRYSVKHHRENKNQDRLPEKDSLKMGTRCTRVLHLVAGNRLRLVARQRTSTWRHRYQ